MENRITGLKIGKNEKKFFLLVSFIFVFIVFFSVIIHINSRVIGIKDYFDLMTTMKAYWEWKSNWTAYWSRSFADGVTPEDVLSFFRELFLYPFSRNIYYFMNFVFFSLFDLFLPYPLFYNVSVLLVFLLNCYAACLFAYYLIKDTVPAAFAGILTCLSLVFYSNLMLGMNERIYFFGIPFFLLYLLKVLNDEGNRVKNSLLAGVWLAVTSSFYWFYAIFALIAGSMFFVNHIIRSGKNRETFIRAAHLLIAAAVFSLLVLPFVWPVLTRDKSEAVHREAEAITSIKKLPFIRSEQEAAHNVAMRKTIEHSGSLGDLFIPAKVHGIPSHIPVIVTLAGLGSLLFIRSVPPILYFQFLLFYILSLGPFIKTGDQLIRPITVSLVYKTFYETVPFFNNYHWPSYISLFTGFFLAVLSGYMVSRVIRKFKWEKSFKRFILPAVILLILFFRLISLGVFPVYASNALMPSFYSKTLGSEGSEVGIIEYPSAFGRSFYNLKIEEIKVLENVLYFHSRYPKTRIFSQDPKVRTMERNSFIDWLRDSSEGLPTRAVNPADVEKVGAMGYKYLVFHDQFFNMTGRGGEKEIKLRELKDILGEPVETDNETWDKVSHLKNGVKIKEYKTKFYVFKLPSAKTTE